MRFECNGCGTPCCAVRDGEEKKIMLFPEEVAFLEQQAIALNKTKFAVIEDLIFPDTLNKIILVGAYRLYLERYPSCDFMRPDNHYCQIQELLGLDQKPLVCRAYPIAIKTIDATTKEYFLDTGCPYIEEHIAVYAGIKNFKTVPEIEAYLRENFPVEFLAANQIINRLSWIPLRLRQLEQEGKIRVPDEFSAEAWSDALATWDRKDLIPDGA
nr:YkgJ family cysteine cluster protein [Candidatus Sigynarchaeota archaeon]